MGFRTSIRALLAIAVIGACDLLAPAPASAGTLVPGATAVFGTYDGVEFVRHTGRFEGATSLGAFGVPYEIVAPADPTEGSGAVLMEAPHWAFPPLARDLVLGRDVIFGRGLSYASVGYGTDGFEILDVSVTDAVIAGDVVEDPGGNAFSGVFDEEILIQFAEALTSAPRAKQILGDVHRVYACGVSRSADALVVALDELSGSANPVFDLTFLHVPSWRIDFPVPPGLFGDGRQFEGPFTPFEGVGRVIVLQAEGDLLAFAAEEFERAAELPDYRVYQVSGAAHLPTTDNPLDHWAVLRAVFVAGDEWVRFGVTPPPSTLIASEPAGEIDPLYGVETGILRDGDLNALGGVRLPDLHLGRALFVASDPDTSTLGIPFLGPLTGSLVDLACEPRPGSATGEPRFESHGDYVSRFVDQVNVLAAQGFLLPADAEAMKERAAESGVGKPGSCP